MTVLDAIKATVAGYPLSNNAFNLALTDRGLSGTDLYTGTSRALELAKADIFMVLATSANVSEGGFSVSIPDRKVFLSRATAIYNRYGEETSGGDTVSDASSAW